MTVEILSARVVLPAFIVFEEDGVQKEIFIYVDHIGNDIIIPDGENINDWASFKEAVVKHMKIGFRPLETPPLPRESLKKLNPEDFLTEEL